ncbi:hypothetical protein [Christiangramia portivictoriae]|uniref:hypothetical protein n=1 Tax=Christiangramia portivictoriae TaxID=326069 RepID=UPI0004081E36|nr:hypothetical protein [Christiangramia portivictoriae]
MKFYYLSKQANDDGVVSIHADSCEQLPSILERVYLGIFDNSRLAAEAALSKYQVLNLETCFCCK